MNPWGNPKMAESSSMESRYSGALLGLAVGDALSTTLEFSTPGTFDPITDMLGGGPFNLNPGEWTDCSGSMIPDTNVGGKIATINEVSDDQKATFFFS